MAVGCQRTCMCTRKSACTPKASARDSARGGGSFFFVNCHDFSKEGKEELT